MFKLKQFCTLPVIFLLFLLVFHGTSLAEETITITTYYPSPYGVYREMRAKRIAIGDNYLDHENYTWEEADGDGGDIDYLADLVVEGNVGIGTTNPLSLLSVGAGPSVGAGTPLYVYGDSGGSGYGAMAKFQRNTEEKNMYLRALSNLYTTVESSGGLGLVVGATDSATGTLGLYIPTSGNVGIGSTGPLYKLDVAGNIVNSNPSQGYIGLTGDLPGYAASTYPTLKTNFTYLYFSVAGAYSAYMNSAGTLTAQSDRAKKENFSPVDLQEILNKIDQLPMTQWNFKGEDPSIKHIAPVAQDFHALFHLNGKDDKMISSIDPSGVALAGVKALLVKVKAQQKQVETQQKQIDELKEELAGLKKENKTEK
ncbi:MAG: tail fiber domain-containing protein [Candidatus Omnitrophota bacterium]|jgi:hypothetical protein